MSLTNKQFILLGPQGSGKGTQAKVLAQSLNIPHISTGDMFRGNISQGTELGAKAESILKAGQLVPDDITNSMIKERLLQDDATHGFVLDGYPRNLDQANFLFKLKPQAVVIVINLSDDDAIKRIAGRRMSKSSGAIYHLQFNPPPVNLPTDDLIQRPDDTAAAVKDRLNIYHKETEPLLNFYKKLDKLITIDGSPPIAEVSSNIMKVLMP